MAREATGRSVTQDAVGRLLRPGLPPPYRRRAPLNSKNRLAMKKTETTDNLRAALHDVALPDDIRSALPITEAAIATVRRARDAIQRIMSGEDDRLLVIAGPCSIHDCAAAVEYAGKLGEARARWAADLAVVMRVYFEKPRTTVGWKGLINDPDLDGSFHINKGLRLARELLLRLNEAEMPAAVEYLDLISPQYIADLVAWGAIGARTTESQGHRELASGVSCPVGFKNGTDGNLKIAVDAIHAARHPHAFMGVAANGRVAIVNTRGNAHCHLILRGGQEPNYDAAGVRAATAALQAAGLPTRLMIDFSHANSRKQHQRQLLVGDNVAAQIAQGNADIMGVMIESHLLSGRQDVTPGTPLVYGRSITDACLGWEATQPLLAQLAEAVQARRRKRAA